MRTLPLLLVLLHRNTYSAKCGAGDACIFMGLKHDPVWVPFVESTGPKPIPPVSDSWRHADTTLFVSIASFRDKLCPRTLFNMFSKAKYPDRIRIGVVQQNAPEDVDCLEGYCELMRKATGAAECAHKEQVRMTRVDSKEAKGPTWGRALGSRLVRDEEFCMQTGVY